MLRIVIFNVWMDSTVDTQLKLIDQAGILNDFVESTEIKHNLGTEATLHEYILHLVLHK